MSNALRLSDYDISEQHGFMPSYEPGSVELPEAFTEFEVLARELPRLITTGHVRSILANMPMLDVDALIPELSTPQIHRAVQIFSFLSHAYIWCDKEEAARILPKTLAVPFYKLTKHLGQPPVLIYYYYTLHNWTLLAEDQPPMLGNIMMLQNFAGGLDEDWFVLVHIEIEYHAARALRAIPGILSAVDAGDDAAVIAGLKEIDAAWDDMYATMERMLENCDPHTYYHRVRPWIHGWKNNPALPEGLIYEGVDEFGGKPQQYRGQTGSQSSIVPTMDALFSISHENDPLREYLIEMLGYMPPKHVEFIKAVEEKSSLRAYAQQSSNEELKKLYSACVDQVAKFRSLHLHYAAEYINKQARDADGNPTDIGTGGTPFMKYLKKHRDEAAEHVLS